MTTKHKRSIQHAIMVLMLSTFCLSALAEGGTWWSSTPWENPDRGYWWYPPDRPPEQTVPEKPPEKSMRLEDIKTMEDLRAEVERRHSEAIMNPTEANVLAFLEAQNYAMDKAAVFADVGRRVTWQHPEVNYTARAPVANFARSSYDKRRTKEQEEYFQKLTETHAILYFASGNCPVCNDQAPVLKGLSVETGMQVLSVSLDGQPLHMFPDAKPDNGISLQASAGQGIPTIPAMYLIDRATKQTIPLATGTIAAADLKERVWILTQTHPGQNF
jgi:conjugal transfer pilus assembly protein TraF